MLVYETGNVLALLFTALAFVLPKQAWQTKWQTAFTWILTPLLVGCHFVYAFWALAMVGLKAWAEQEKRVWIVLFLWCLLFAAVVIAAPGNYQRYSVRMSETTVTLAYVLTRSIGSFGEFLVREISLVQNWLWIAFGAIFLSCHVDCDKNRPTEVKILMRIVAILLPLFGIFVLSAMTREVPPPARTLNAVHYLFVTGIVFLLAPVVLNIRWVTTWLAGAVGSTSRFWHVSAITLCFAILSPNYVRCVRELITAGAEYREYWDHVERQVAEARERGLHRVEIPADPERRPITVFHPSFLGPDPQAWPNREYAMFFGIPEVVAAGAP